MGSLRLRANFALLTFDRSAARHLNWSSSNGMFSEATVHKLTRALRERFFAQKDLRHRARRSGRSEVLDRGAWRRRQGQEVPVSGVATAHSPQRTAHAVEELRTQGPSGGLGQPRRGRDCQTRAHRLPICGSHDAGRFAAPLREGPPGRLHDAKPGHCSDRQICKHPVAAIRMSVLQSSDISSYRGERQKLVKGATMNSAADCNTSNTGGVDEAVQVEVGSIAEAQAAVACQAAGAASSRTTAVLEGDCPRAYQRGRGGNRWRVSSCLHPLVPTMRRYASIQPCAISHQAHRTVPGICRA